MDPNQVIDEGWEDDVVVPGVADSGKGKTYANMKLYVDGRQVWTYYRYGTDQIFKTESLINKPQAAKWEAQEKERKSADVRAEKRVVRTSTGADPQTGRPATVTEYEDGTSSYQEIGSARDARTPERAAQDAEELREKQWNQANGGLYETHAERRARDAREGAHTRAEATANRPNIQYITRNGVIYQVTTDPATAQTTTTRVADLPAEQPKPETLGTATPAQPFIAIWNPRTGEYEQRPNPVYDQQAAHRQQVKDKLEEIALQMQLENRDKAWADAEFQRWYQTEVKVPLELTGEARLQAAERRAERDSRRRAMLEEASFEQNRQTTAMRAGQDAVEAEAKLLPYRVGTGFGSEYANALNSLVGIPSGASSASDIKFSPGAFTFRGPNFSEVARKGTLAALRHLSPLAAERAEAEGIPEDYLPPLPTPREPPPPATRRTYGAYVPGGEAP